MDISTTKASRASPPASAESIPITSVARSAPALTPTASSRQLVAKLEFAVVKVRTSVEMDASDEVEAKLGSAHRRYQRAMSKSKIDFRRSADALSPSPLRDNLGLDSLPVTGISAASAADILDVHDTAAARSDEDYEEDDHAANDDIASHPPLQREFTHIFEQSEIKASRPHFPPCPSPFDCSAAAWAARRRLAYHLFESPRSSALARVLAFISITLIIVSIVSLVLETEPALAGYGTLWASIEILCVSYFTVEYALRLWSAPLDSWAFCTNFSNVMDAVSILPFYIFLVYRAVSDVNGNLSSTVDSGPALFRVLRVVRIFRVFRISRYVSWFKIFSAAAIESGLPLLMMFCIVVCGVIFSASVLYFIEHGAVDSSGVASHFTSVHTSMWFVFISIATVGYGEIVPATPAGKFVSAVICILGVLVLAIPVSVLSQNFLTEFEAIDRHTVRMRARIGNRSGRQVIGGGTAVDAALEGRPATFHHAAAMSARQLQIAELRHDQLLQANIDRILQRTGTWGAELDGLLHDDRERTAQRLRQILTRQFNGRIWDNISA